MSPPTPLPALTLYVHIPWCVRKCPYCDFNSHEARGDLPQADYVEALCRDMAADVELAGGRKLDAVFFGGGTPSLFSSRAIEQIIQAAEHYFGIAAGAEITLETNPGTAEHSNFRDLRQTGVNRISLGVQSFHPQQLRQLGRIHGRDEALRAYAMAVDSGFDNINIDLMHGLPSQSVQEALADIEQATALTPSHISWYQLTIEPNTRFYSRPPVLPADDTLADIQEAGHERLTHAGYQQYEVSAYAQRGRQSRHNYNYWEFGDYLAVGAGAHGKITRAAPNDILRYRKTRLPQDYLADDKAFTAASDVIALSNLPLEFMMNALRLTDGVPRGLFERRTGLPLSQIDRTLRALIGDDLLENSATHIKATPLGQRFLNDLLARFMPGKGEENVTILS